MILTMLNDVDNKLEVSMTTINWNVIDELDKCINSVLNTYKDLNFEWFIIDNNSHQLGFDSLIAKYSYNKRIKFIKNNKNEGLAVLNKILEKVKGRYWIFIDPDTLQKGKPILELIKFMDKHPQAGMATPVQLHPNGKPSYYIRTLWTITKFFFYSSSLGRFIDKYLLHSRMFKRFVYKSSNLDNSRLCQIEQIPFACTIERIELILEDNYVIDPTLSFSYNDVDLCKRVWDKGYKIFQVPTAEIIHNHGKAYRKANPEWRFKIAQKSQIQYFRKHYKNSIWLLKILLIIELIISSLKRKLIKKLRLNFKYLMVTSKYVKIRDIIRW